MENFEMLSDINCIVKPLILTHTLIHVSFLSAFGLKCHYKDRDLVDLVLFCFILSLFNKTICVLRYARIT